ncbi:flagellar hook assembly protein FlgD [Planomonospora venezuelensis]|uniref:Flagellar basal-body rod modification protein FlgD n=1 Tax=Planomonospora venezuelensis TaxID=1999 RepID=A0A841DCU3_PLAVE|nr:flagellar basal-body rod modification protein FlgD [Planomonospora venezuelensis]GIM98604.1 flagellar hook capping protein [Planomonospora venezuelensis]
MTNTVSGAASPITAATTAATASSAPAASNSQLDKDTFLKLLVAQMRYQDPSKPADTSQFLSQTAQFTEVERMEQLVKQQGELLAAQLQLSASNLVGKTISYTGPDGTDAVGVVTSASFGSAPTLKVGNTDVPLSSVKEVTSAASTGTEPTEGN